MEDAPSRPIDEMRQALAPQYRELISVMSRQDPSVKGQLAGYNDVQVATWIDVITEYAVITKTGRTKSEEVTYVTSENGYGNKSAIDPVLDKLSDKLMAVDVPTYWPSLTFFLNTVARKIFQSV